MCVLVIRSIPWVAGAQTERPAWGHDVGEKETGHVPTPLPPGPVSRGESVKLPRARSPHLKGEDDNRIYLADLRGLNGSYTSGPSDKACYAAGAVYVFRMVVVVLRYRISGSSSHLQYSKA